MIGRLAVACTAWPHVSGPGKAVYFIVKTLCVADVQ
jgi:hypothetical protein